MMKIFLYTSLSSLMVALSLISFADSASKPKWLDQVIKSNFPKGTATEINPPIAKHIYRYTYKDKKVYYVPSRCCDIQSSLYDSTGKQLCSPDGGKSGRGDGKCADFFEQRSNEEVIWP